MPVAESSVLRPKHADLKNPDDWPIFILTHANVISLETGSPCSLLAAHKDNRVKVVGRLCEIEDEQSHLILDSSYVNQTIQLENVTTYSFAEYPDGTYGFWAAGEAGWFELEETVAKYKPILDDMNVATSMLYFIADKLRRSRKTDFTDAEFNKHIRRLFHDYYMQAKFPELFVDSTDVREGFETHRHFLISSIFEGQEGIVWNEAPLLRYFGNKFPEDVQHHKFRIFGVKTNAQPDDTEKQKSRSPPSDTTPQKKRRGRPPKDLRKLQLRTPVSNRDNNRDRINIDFDDLDVELNDDTDSDKQATNPRKRKSILQPSGSKYAKKAKKGAGKTRSRLIPENLDPTDDDEDQQEQRGEVSPITIITNGKQLRKITNYGNARRRASQSPPPPDFLPRKFLDLKVFDIDVQDTTPQGPGDLWTCPLEGCLSRIHDGLSEIGKSKIHEHLKSHQNSAQDRIHLALNESRPYLPVDNLVRRLQAVAPSPGDQDPRDPGRQFVAPIRRKY